MYVQFLEYNERNFLALHLKKKNPFFSFFKFVVAANNFLWFVSSFLPFFNISLKSDLISVLPSIFQFAFFLISQFLKVSSVLDREYNQTPCNTDPEGSIESVRIN